jgi:hypothetical protein
MGWGKTIVLTCKCGFETNRAMVGQLLAHESSSGGFTVLEVTYDSANRRIVEHAISLPAELEELLDHEPTRQDEDAVNTWFENQRRIIRTRHGDTLDTSQDRATTALQCPECRVGNLVLAVTGDWIA